jgi:putative SOS response-associated peptidase YedK
MCYYNGVKVTKNELIKLLKLEKEIGEFINSEIALRSGYEYQDWPILKPVDGGKDFELTMAHWELIAPWHKTMEEVIAARKKANTLNATGENLFERNSYKDAALKRRCLILSSGFYEWRHYKPEGSKKDITYPYYVSLQDKPYFFIAGIYQPWTDKSTGETMDTFSLVTTEGNSLMKNVHNKKGRMPTILPEELAHEWIQDGLSKERITQLATYQLPSEQMQAHTIYKDFKAYEDPTAEFAYAELPPLGNDGPLMNIGLFS